MSTYETNRGSRFARLPLWARNEIAALEARVQRETEAREAAETAAKGAVEASGAHVWLNPYGKVATPLAARGVDVRFSLQTDGGLDTWNWVDVRIARHKPSIHITAGRGVRVRPCASNTVEIELENY